VCITSCLQPSSSLSSHEGYDVSLASDMSTEPRLCQICHSPIRLPGTAAIFVRLTAGGISPPPGDVFPPPPPGAYSLRLLTICIDCRSRLCAKFVAHLFPRPELPPSSSRSTVKLTYFIVYALHRTKLPPSVCGPHPPSTTQGAFSHRTGIIGPSSLRIRIHVGQQGHLRQCMFEQIHPLPLCHPLVLTPASSTCSRSSTSSPLQMSR